MRKESRRGGNWLDQQTLPAVDFRRLFDALPGLYLVLDPQFVIVAASDGYLRATTMQRETILGRLIFEVFPDPTEADANGADPLRASLSQVVRTLAPHSMPVRKYRFECSEGSVEERFWRPLNTPVLDGGGQLAWVIHQVEDVTDFVRFKQRKWRDQKAIEAQSRLAAIVHSSEDAIIGKTLDGIITSWNFGAEKIFGYTPQEVIGKPVLMLFPPERGDEEGVILGRVAGGESVAHYETVRLAKDGRRIDVSVTISPIKDPRGNVIGASKIARDITLQKQAEARLRQAAIVFTSSQEGVIITAPNGTIVAVNPAACAITAYDEQELLGNNMRLVKSERHDPAFYRQIFETIAEDGYWQGGIVARTAKSIRPG